MKKNECCVDEKIPVFSKGKSHASGAGGGAVYGLGLIGALVYFLQHATNFGEGVLGFLKALVWPALLVYQLLKGLGL
jgi:hypothetical protein